MRRTLRYWINRHDVVGRTFRGEVCLSSGLESINRVYDVKDKNVMMGINFVYNGELRSSLVVPSDHYEDLEVPVSIKSRESIERGV